jgi:phosphatidylserine decarboxylase
VNIARGGWPWVAGALGIPGAAAVAAWSLNGGGGLVILLSAAAVVGAAWMLFFFRDPERHPPADPRLVVSGADGVVRTVESFPEHPLLAGPAVRVSVFLSPLNVHVNRSPIVGVVRSVEYAAGRHLFTFDDRASEVNEHSTIVIGDGARRCVVRQIVGPVVRRVVCWLREGEPVERGGRLGLMKFGSRLDIYLPEGAVDILVRKGDRVRAGETPLARWREEG